MRAQDRPCGENYKLHVLIREGPVQSAGPWVDPMHIGGDRFVCREFFCPGCVTLLDVEITRAVSRSSGTCVSMSETPPSILTADSSSDGEESPVLRTRWSSSETKDLLEIRNPATGRVIRLVQGGGEKEIDQAVRAAHEAQHAWSRRAPAPRGKYLLAASRLIREPGTTSRLSSRSRWESPSPRRVTSMSSSAWCCSSTTQGSSKFFRARSTTRDTRSTSRFLEPYGVIGGIIPFNWPPLHVGGKAAPALAVGNACVLKPPEQCPLVIMRIVELVQSVLPRRRPTGRPRRGGGRCGACRTFPWWARSFSPVPRTQEGRYSTTPPTHSPRP